MAREEYKAYEPNTASQLIIMQCNGIVANYASQGLRLTLRQLYYQLVTQNIVVNTERSYQNLSSLVSKARLGGLMDWDAIEDRVRRPQVPQEFTDLKELVEVAARSYRLPRWQGQANYVELWVEKDALAGVLAPIAHKYHVTLMVNRGYSSQSAMYESAERFKDVQHERDCYLFYLGDMDPSGEDMVRDIKDRLEMFGVHDLSVDKLALTMAQVNHYNPPPNPAKLTDPRSEAYVKKHGNSSWEVDALPPNVLTKIISDALDKAVDMNLMKQVMVREEQDKRDLRDTASVLSRGPLVLKPTKPKRGK